MGTYRWEHNKSFTDQKGVKTVIKMSIIDGDLGLSFTYTEKIGDHFYKIYTKAESDKYIINEKNGEKEEPPREVDQKAYEALIKKNKNLQFVRDYMLGDMIKYKVKKGGAKKKKKKKKKGGKKKKKKKKKKK